MCNVNEILNDLIKIIDKVNEEYENSKNELAKLDKMRSDILHLIENKDNFNAAEGYKYSKALQFICKERRIVKNKMEVLRSLRDKTKLNNNSIKDSANSCISILNKKKEISSKGIESYTSKILNLSGGDVLENVKLILNK